MGAHPQATQAVHTLTHKHTHAHTPTPASPDHEFTLLFPHCVFFSSIDLTSTHRSGVGTGRSCYLDYQLRSGAHTHEGARREEGGGRRGVLHKAPVTSSAPVVPCRSAHLKRFTVRMYVHVTVIYWL